MTEDLDIDLSCYTQKSDLNVDNPIANGLPGFMVKMITIMGDLTIILELEEVEPTKFEKEHFSVPTGYKIEPFDNWLKF